jgi:hypothetical protein
LQEGGDGLAVGRFLHALDQRHDLRQRRLAHRLGGRRPLFQERQHRFDAAPELADHAGGFQVLVDALAGEDGERFRHDVLEHVFDRLEARIENGPVGLHQGVLVFGFGHGHFGGASGCLGASLLDFGIVSCKSTKPNASLGIPRRRKPGSPRLRETANCFPANQATQYVASIA